MPSPMNKLSVLTWKVRFGLLMKNNPTDTINIINKCLEARVFSPSSGDNFPAAVQGLLKEYLNEEIGEAACSKLFEAKGQAEVKDVIDLMGGKSFSNHGVTTEIELLGYSNNYGYYDDSSSSE